MIGISSPGKPLLREQVAQFQLDQVQQFLVVHHVHFVEEDDDARHFDLAGQQNVLAGLRHRTVGGRDDQDGAVHLGGAGDHVLDIVGMPGGVDMGIVAFVGFVFDMRDVDRDAALALFGGVVDRVIRAEGGDAAIMARVLVIAAVRVVLP